MSTSFFSIIIPVYNDEKNLRRCLDSVLSQTFGDFECLLINDGSTDGSQDICDEYAEKNSRIRVFHKKNEGTSKTRQFGITYANGAYTFFLDSDDWIEASFLADAVKKLENDNVDIMLMDFYRENASGKELYIRQKPTALDAETVIRLELEGKLFSCLWSILISRNLYIQNKVIFTEDINYGEDSLFIIELLLNNPRIGYLEGAYYHFTHNSSSFTRKNRKERFRERLKFLDQLSLLLEKYKRNDLEAYNFFPLIDKYEMLCSGVFSRKEYQALFSPRITPYYLKRSGFRKYFLLKMAETKFYSVSQFLARFLRQVKNRLA